MNLPASVPVPSSSVATAMPFKIAHVEGITIIELSGCIIGLEIVEAAEAAVYHPLFKHGQPHIWDARTVTQVLVDANEAPKCRAHVAKYAPYLGHARAAVVAPAGIDRMLAEFIRWHLRGRPIEAFGSMDDARAWVLGR